MSSSSAVLKQTFHLTLTNLPEDADMTIYDGRDEVCFTFTGKSSITVALPKGLYNIRGNLAGVIRETPVRLDRDATLVNSKQVQIAPPQYSAAPLKGTALSHEYYRYPSQQWSIQFTRPPLPSAVPMNSSIFVFIRPRDVGDVAQLSTQTYELRLLNELGEVVSSFDPSETRKDDNYGWLAFSAQAPAGYYSLECIGNSSRGMAIHLFPNWQTQVFLLNHGKVLLEGARIFLAKQSTGFNPERDDLAVATDLGLDFLQNNSGRLPNALLRQLLQLKFENPMLGLVGAHALLKQQKSDPQLLQIVISNLKMLLGDCADVAAVQLLNARRVGLPPDFVPFDHPPMFRAALEAVIDASFEQDKLLPEGGEIERLAPNLLSDSPWSSWDLELQAAEKSAQWTEIVESYPTVFDSYAGVDQDPIDSPSLDWIQAAFLETAVAQLRAKQRASKFEGQLHRQLMERLFPTSRRSDSGTIRYGGAEIELQTLARKLRLPVRTVTVSLNALLSAPVSPDVMLSLFEENARQSAEFGDVLQAYWRNARGSSKQNRSTTYNAIHEAAAEAESQAEAEPEKESDSESEAES
jgi:hypothetical protein